jgi:hypothetical protein
MASSIYTATSAGHGQWGSKAEYTTLGYISYLKYPKMPAKYSGTAHRRKELAFRWACLPPLQQRAPPSYPYNDFSPNSSAYKYLIVDGLLISLLYSMVVNPFIQSSDQMS